MRLMGLILLAMLLGLAAMVLATCYALLWLAARFVHPSLAAILGTAGVAVIAYAIVDGIITCNAPPIYAPSSLGDYGEKLMIHACDGPGGVATCGSSSSIRSLLYVWHS